MWPPELDQQLASAFGGFLSPGDHTVQCSVGPNYHIAFGACWAALIEPAFVRKAVLAVANMDKGARAVLALIDDGYLALNRMKAVPLDEWQDPLLKHLHQLDLLVTHRHRTLDGVGYTLKINGGALDACISFANPDQPQLLAVQDAIHRAGQAVAKAQLEFVSALPRETDWGLSGEDLVFSTQDKAAWQAEVEASMAYMKKTGANYRSRG
jgi:hypothetical protein